MAAMFGVFVDEDYSKIPMLNWFPKLHKNLISQALFLAHILLLSCL